MTLNTWRKRRNQERRNMEAEKEQKKKKKRKIFETKTDVIVFIRSVFELVVIGVVLFMLIRLFVTPDRYVSYDKNDANIVPGSDNGFICISYVGVDRTGTDTLVADDDLEQQLAVLKELGYVTITQQDIIDYKTMQKRVLICISIHLAALYMQVWQFMTPYGQ